METKLKNQSLDTTTRLSSKLITFTRDGEGSSGDVSYTGVGFTPTSIHFRSVVGATKYWSSSLTDSSKSSSGLFQSADNVVRWTTNAVMYSDQNTFAQSAVVKTFDADGFTLTWTKAASPPTATITIYALCYR